MFLKKTQVLSCNCYENFWYKLAIVSDDVRNSSDPLLSHLSDLCFMTGRKSKCFEEWPEEEIWWGQDSELYKTWHNANGSKPSVYFIIEE
jgi:hypothetical protein